MVNETYYGNMMLLQQFLRLRNYFSATVSNGRVLLAVCTDAATRLRCGVIFKGSL